MLDQISPRMRKAVLTLEDDWFYYHPGFNPVSLVDAVIANLRAGEIKRGGSTITMQIARMMEPKERTIPNKIIELFRAVQLELHYSKNDLFEIYFNLVPYGGNIEGIGAASFFYFDKKPSELSWSEVAVLTAIPASPTQFRPDRNPDLCRKRRDLVLKRLEQTGIISQDEIKAALTEEIPAVRRELQFVAPHFCQTVLNKYPENCEIHSTINYEIQSVCEKLALSYHNQLVNKDINNLSLVILNNSTGEIQAMVGSPDFNDTRHGGQINGAFAGHSPGSALKPFIYAIAFELGLLTPAQKIEDIPINYSGYTPVNYDEKYHGVVSVREALINSFNIPAVNIASMVGLERFQYTLQQGGITTLTKQYYEYGLPLVLGACDIQLIELCNLYSTFAREGLYLELSDTGDSNIPKSERLFSEEVCYLISDILSNLKRPDIPTSWEFTADMPRVAWKTGTSYGRKDAWSIGYNPTYTVGVWAGNFSGQGSVDIVGAQIATPLMMDIFHEISNPSDKLWFTQPEGVSLRKVCTVTGLPPNEYCPETKLDLSIPGVSPVRQCDVHTHVRIDNLTEYRLCQYCSYGKNYHTEIMENWPSKIATWLNKTGGVIAIPEHNPDCKGMLEGDAPVITSPEENAVYEQLDYIPDDYQKILFEASATSGSGKIHFFLDGELFASTESGAKLFYNPTVGKHILLCIDDDGHSSSIRFEVK